MRTAVLEIDEENLGSNFCASELPLTDGSPTFLDFLGMDDKTAND